MNDGVKRRKYMYDLISLTLLAEKIYMCVFKMKMCLCILNTFRKKINEISSNMAKSRGEKKQNQFGI